jgi:hypothetical protein
LAALEIDSTSASERIRHIVSNLASLQSSLPLLAVLPPERQIRIWAGKLAPQGDGTDVSIPEELFSVRALFDSPGFAMELPRISINSTIRVVSKGKR